MSEYFECRAAGDRDQRYSACFGGPDGKRGRSRNRHQYARADHRGFLNHLDRDPAGENDRAAFAGNPCSRKGPCQLVERIVAADILPGEDKALIRQIEAGCMGSARRAVEVLRVGERFDSLSDLARAKRDSPGR